MNKFKIRAAAVAITALSACGGAPAGPPPLEGAKMGGAFRLTNPDGKTVTDADFAGKYRLVYFGYTFCPDVCPVDVQIMGQGLSAFEKMDPVRGAKVIEYARHVLDRCVPLKTGSHLDSTGYRVVDNELAVTLANGKTVGLKNRAQFVGFQGEMDAPSSVLLSHHGLHLDIIINRKTPIGSTDAAGVCDLVLESALSTILDLEDSVAVVDAADKVLAYGNWLGILKGT
ncbi:MAG: hypothetical protein CFE44_27495, partial [Burkholderiales bacterium PBB4]